jgi:hypothetical protein
MSLLKYFQNRGIEQKPEPTKPQSPPERISLATPPICHRVPGKPGLSNALDAARSAVDLAKSGYLGTAVERIEAQLQMYPDDFGLLMELAEVQALHCGNILTAEKIVTRIENNFRYEKSQREEAIARLKVWRERVEKTRFRNGFGAADAPANPESVSPV